jgi:hypothetical protein
LAPTEAGLFRLGLRLLRLLNWFLFHLVKKHQNTLRQFRWRSVTLGKRLPDGEHGIVQCRLTAG